jgi:hypothetical protein
VPAGAVLAGVLEDIEVELVCGFDAVEVICAEFRLWCRQTARFYRAVLEPGAVQASNHPADPPASPIPAAACSHPAHTTSRRPPKQRRVTEDGTPDLAAPEPDILDNAEPPF